MSAWWCSWLRGRAQRHLRVTLVGVCMLAGVAYLGLQLYLDSFNLTVVDSERFDAFVYKISENAVKDSPSGQECRLPVVDPWDPAIRPFLNSSYDPLKNCVPEGMYTALRDGKLQILKSFAGECFCRCLRPFNDSHSEKDPWEVFESGFVVECDVVEVRCIAEDELAVAGEFTAVHDLPPLYVFIHAQIYRSNAEEKVQKSKKLSKIKNERPGPPDVHVIVLDAVSHSSILRSMNRTLSLLRDSFGAVEFSHLNKVAYNSQPNGFALLLGKAVERIARSPYSEGKAEDYEDLSWCLKPLDHDQFIGFRYQDAGYRTMMAEDWSMGVLNWPDCVGFNKTPTHHYMRPFQLEAARINDEQGNPILKKQCLEPYTPLLEYLEAFIDAYPEQPKFSMVWTVDLAHSDVNSLFHVDSVFHDYFVRLKEKLSNAYVILTSDHGLHYTPVRETQIGQREDLNPLLFVIPPQHLRGSSQVKTLRQNARNLVSHYDTYATLVDLAKPKKARTPTPVLHGHSLLKPLPQGRSCESMRIPFVYCLCEAKKTRLPSNHILGLAAAETMVTQMNALLARDNATRAVCSKLGLSAHRVETNQLQGTPEMDVYEVLFRTWPGNGAFSGYVGHTRNTSRFVILSERFPRENSYASQVGCLGRHPLISYCFCKNLVSIP